MRYRASNGFVRACTGQTTTISGHTTELTSLHVTPLPNSPALLSMSSKKLEERIRALQKQPQNKVSARLLGVRECD